jgi:hypothetical protein
VKSVWWTRSSSETGVPLQGFETSSDRRDRHRSPLTLMGLPCPSKLAAGTVAVVRLRHPPRRFDDLAVFPFRLRRRRSADNSLGLGPPSGHFGLHPPGDIAPDYPLEVFRPYSGISMEVHMTRASKPDSFRLQGFPPS